MAATYWAALNQVFGGGIVTSAVELRQVSKTYSDRLIAGREVTAVRNINLQIEQGEFFTLLGPSGCGKTTTLRMIAGFETVTSGELLIQGQPMMDVPPNKRPINTVFQNYALFPHLTVAQNVAFGLTVKRVPQAERDRRVEEALELVRLPGFGRRRPDQLSGGQQQRVALARALVNRPSVLLLDEPLGALDLKLRKEMQIELKQLQVQVGITFIYVTHDQEEALTMSDRIGVMSLGQLLQVDTPKRLYDRPATRFVADFIGESNFLTGKVEAVEADKATLVVAGAQARLANTAELQSGQSITLCLRPEKIQLGTTSLPNAIQISGIVNEVVYIGTDSRYMITLTTGEKVVARLQNDDDEGEGVSAGDTVNVWWKPTDMRILAE